MNTRPWQDTLDLFLEGRLTGDELAGFTAQLRSDAELRRGLETASGTEAAFHAMSWGLSTGIATQTFPENESSRADPYSKQEWQSLVDAAFRIADNTLPAQRNKILAFPRFVRYLAAACLTFALAGFIVWTQRSRTPDQTRIVAIGQMLKDTVKSSSFGKMIDTVVTRIAFDSVIIYSRLDAVKKPVCPAGNDGILQLADRTAVLLEKNSSLEIRQQLDSSVTLDMQYGSALFTVEKMRYRDFRVYTPESEIKVIGTVFRVRAEKDTTIVSVKEGSVNTRCINDTGYVAVPAGMTGYISATGVVLAHGDSAATLPYKRNLLRDFLEENGVWENGCFIRSGFSSHHDTDTRALNR